MLQGAMYLDIIAQFSDYCCFTYAVSSNCDFPHPKISWAVLFLATFSELAAEIPGQGPLKGGRHSVKVVGRVHSPAPQHGSFWSLRASQFDLHRPSPENGRPKEFEFEHPLIEACTLGASSTWKAKPLGPFLYGGFRHSGYLLGVLIFRESYYGGLFWGPLFAQSPSKPHIDSPSLNGLASERLGLA